MALGAVVMVTSGDDVPPEATSSSTTSPPTTTPTTSEPTVDPADADTTSSSASIRPGVSEFEWSASPFDLDRLPASFTWLGETLAGVTPDDQLLLIDDAGTTFVEPPPIAEHEAGSMIVTMPGALMALDVDDLNAVPFLSVDAQTWFQPALDSEIPVPDSDLILVEVGYRPAVSVTALNDGAIEGHVYIERRTAVRLDIDAVLNLAGLSDTGDETTDPFDQFGPQWVIIGDVLQVDRDGSGDRIDVPLDTLQLSDNDEALLRRRRSIEQGLPTTEHFAGPISGPLAPVEQLGSSWFTVSLTAGPEGFVLLGTDVSLATVRTSIDGLTWESSDDVSPFRGSFGNSTGRSDLTVADFFGQSFGGSDVSIRRSFDAGNSWTTLRTPARQLLDASTGSTYSILAGWNDVATDGLDVLSEATVQGDGYTFAFTNEGPATVAFDSGEIVSVDPEAPETLRFDDLRGRIELFRPDGSPLITLPIERLFAASQRAAARNRDGLQIGVADVDGIWTWTSVANELGVEAFWAETIAGDARAIVFVEAADGGLVLTGRLP